MLSPTAYSRLDMIGILAVLCACCISGFAGVYVEKRFKATALTIWERNLQLSFWGIAMASASLYWDRERVKQKGVFAAFSRITCALACIHAFGGLLVAVVVKYTSTVVKAFATSCGIVLTSVISAVMFNTPPKPLFILGSTCAIVATFAYNTTGSKDGLPPPEPPLISTTTQKRNER